MFMPILSLPFLHLPYSFSPLLFLNMRACVRACVHSCSGAVMQKLVLSFSWTVPEMELRCRLGSGHLCLLRSLPSPFFISSCTCWLDTCLLWRLIRFMICTLWCLCIICYLKFKFFRKLESWLGGLDHWLLLQKTWIWSSAPTQRLITICNCSSKEFAALFWPPRTLNEWDPNTYIQGKHTPKINYYFFILLFFLVLNFRIFKNWSLNSKITCLQGGHLLIPFRLLSHVVTTLILPFLILSSTVCPH